MCKLSKRIEIHGAEAVRVRQDGERVELVLIDEKGAEWAVPVKMEVERPAAVAA